MRADWRDHSDSLEKITDTFWLGVPSSTIIGQNICLSQ